MAGPFPQRHPGLDVRRVGALAVRRSSWWLSGKPIGPGDGRPVSLSADGRRATHADRQPGRGRSPGTGRPC
ncbi:hypothetical protein KCH_00390 [Kitasatospora cheerisanensis KCTC 2395]|uniref:Uncharacterized protein n=1 Tax=Kitasatospora cheerisanensis KCTC 2395 TaxID=1348663 RepID=A0A066Z7J7_9ACTN|nr:hypothetical protein KCH_00390 [Kitasatospora cheerisanensis KCTC 2395]